MHHSVENELEMTTIPSSYQSSEVSEEEANSLLPMSHAVRAGRYSSGKLLWTCLGVVVGVACIGFAVSPRTTVAPAPAETQESDPVSDTGEPNIVVELEGGKKSLKYCEDGGYSKRTLKLAYELPFHALFRDNKGQKKYEASSIVIVGDNAYAVCDSSWSISKFDSQLTPFADSNIQIGQPDREEEDSGYEALFYDAGNFYVVRESIKHDDKSYHAVIEELTLGTDEYEMIDACSAEFEFEGDSKGFEGAIPVHDATGELHILGLCEGNHCSESKKDDAGHGRIVVMKKEIKDGVCQWSTVRTIHIPSSAEFRDYSALSMTQEGKVAISSQEESQLWVGQLVGVNGAGGWNIEEMEFDPDAGKIYDFPKNEGCHTVYCNIEGVHWLNNDMIIAVSDKMKSKGKQDFRCFNKDQSVHVFVLP